MPIYMKYNGYQTIYDIPVNAKSRASYLLLIYQLRDFVDDGFWANDLKKWLKFRQEFIENELNEKGELKCNYCGRNDLVPGFYEFENKNKNHQIPNLATIDHVIPLSKGGAKYDKDNCVIACKTCNKNKKDKIY